MLFRRCPRRDLIADINRLKRQSITIMALMFAMQRYAGLILHAARQGAPLADEDVLAIGDWVRDRALKNFRPEGLSIDDEAHALREAIENFDQLCRGVIEAARIGKGDDRNSRAPK